jgi:D-tyrosyl-tRNA(Tyr) deacylase
MRVVIQRVSEARVKIAGVTVGEIGRGLLVLLGVAPTDTAADAQWLAEKIAKLRIFPDADGHMNLSVLDLTASENLPTASASTAPASENVGGALRPDSASVAQPSALHSQPPPPAPTVLVVSQFTLFASTRKGTRPSFNDAAKPDLAIPLYETFCRLLSAALGRPVATGQFGAMMAVSLVNDGPVTLIIDSRQRE